MISLWSQLMTWNYFFGDATLDLFSQIKGKHMNIYSLMWPVSADYSLILYIYIYIIQHVFFSIGYILQLIINFAYIIFISSTVRSEIDCIVIQKIFILFYFNMKKKFIFYIYMNQFLESIFKNFESLNCTRIACFKINKL